MRQGLDKQRPATRFQHASDFPADQTNIGVMQDRNAENKVKRLAWIPEVFGRHDSGTNLGGNPFFFCLMQQVVEAGRNVQSIQRIGGN